jgi:[ribosomal protein S5]-alanine N-acetyltransferase
MGNRGLMGKVIETERLYLKVFEKDDNEATKKFWGDTEVMDQSGGATPHNLLSEILKSYRKCHFEKGLSVYAVIEKESSQVIGAAGFNVRETVGKIEIVYHFSKSSWGKGFATEAAKACIELAEINRNVKTIYASADPDNASSIKILEKLGFQFLEMRWFEDTSQNEPFYEYQFM